MMMTEELRAFNTHTAKELARLLAECAQSGKTLDEVERALQQVLQCIGLESLKFYAAQAGDGDVGRTLEHEGRTLRRSDHRLVKQYQSIFGMLQIERFVYWERPGQRIERSPTDEALGLPQGQQSYVLEDYSQQLATQMPYGEVADVLKRLLGINVTVRSLETANQKLASYVESFRESQPPVNVQSDAEIVVVTADGKGVPMRQSQEERMEQELGKKKVTRESTLDYEKTTKRRGPGGKKSKKQAAYVGGVYTVDPFVRTADAIIDETVRNSSLEDRPRPQNKRCVAEMNVIVAGEISYGQTRAFEFIRKQLDDRNVDGKKTVVCLMDGQKSLWYWRKTTLPESVGILDLFHVMERLWTAAYCFHPMNSLVAEEFVERYLRMLLEGKVGSVIGVFRRFLKGLKGTKATDLQRVIDYFSKHKTYMQYDSYISAGYPIASGVVEGACRHVVKDRMERSGMRWSIGGAQAMLHLRTVNINGNWPKLIEHRIETEQNQIHATAA